MKTFYKQLMFIAIGVVVIATGVLVIRAATPGGRLKVNPILGHDLDLNAGTINDQFPISNFQ